MRSETEDYAAAGVLTSTMMLPGAWQSLKWELFYRVRRFQADLPVLLVEGSGWFP